MTVLSYPDLLRVFGRIGLLSFGGPAAQIALMHKELVDDRPWLTEDEFLRALSFCMLLPGPEAMQLATYAGWRIRGVPGGLLAGLLFVLPGAIVMVVLALLYAQFGNLPLTAAMFLGVKATVVIIVIQALLRLGRKALKTKNQWGLAAASFISVFFLNLPFPLIILGAGIFGYVTSQTTETSPHKPVQLSHLSRTIGIWASAWLGPILFLWILGAEFLLDLALFFSKLALVTFGGAYAVLAYMTQTVVQDHGWITTTQMMDGLGLAETTPGPLILVTQFVGMLAGSAQGGVPLAIAAGVITLWVTFIPCFLWIFAGAPFIDHLATRPKLSSALSAITAAIVGVILNLSVWFALHVFFDRLRDMQFGPLSFVRPDMSSLNIFAVFLCAASAWALMSRNLPLPIVLALSAMAGAATVLI